MIQTIGTRYHNQVFKDATIYEIAEFTTTCDIDHVLHQGKDHLEQLFHDMNTVKKNAVATLRKAKQDRDTLIEVEVARAQATDPKTKRNAIEAIVKSGELFLKMTNDIEELSGFIGNLRLFITDVEQKLWSVRCEEADRRADKKAGIYG